LFHNQNQIDIQKSMNVRDPTNNLYLSS
jgi:hypothetical protein